MRAKETRREIPAPRWSTKLRKDALKTVGREVFHHPGHSPVPQNRAPHCRERTSLCGRLKWTPNSALDPNTRPLAMNTVVGRLPWPQALSASVPGQLSQTQTPDPPQHQAPSAAQSFNLTPLPKNSVCFLYNRSMDKINYTFCIRM